MKLGVLGALPRAFADLTLDAIRGVRAMGFSGTGLPGGDDPAGVSNETAREAGKKFQDAGVELIEYGRYGSNLVTRNDAQRKADIASLAQACRVARGAGCPAVITGAGSMNPRGGWFPDRENRSTETRDRLIASLREAVRAAEGEGVILGLECHTVTPLYDAASTRDILDAVGSKSLRVHLDPINWLTFETVYDSGAATRKMFEVLGADRLLGSHDKGASVEDKLIIHMSEAVTGSPEDIFDHGALIREAARMPAGFYLAIEHLKPDQMPAARDHLLSIAKTIGVTFET
ncbi:MAG: sugar phosphate isomerase/epimerase [Chloroflexota bacterium]|nr:MAG: sugar phosphate isomerase/epimerase [Chloroflexota bacterium]